MIHVLSGAENFGRSLEGQGSQQGAVEYSIQSFKWKPATCANFFFSVLRLCGSRQVVAPCRADERITQMHSLYPSLGVQKWSKITTKWCQFQNEKPTKTQQKTNTHNPHPKQHQTKTKRKREHGMTAPKSNGIKCFWISRSCTKTTRQQTKRQKRKITRRCSAKHIDQQCRNPGSPLPGSRRSHWGAFRHKTPSQ